MHSSQKLRADARTLLAGCSLLASLSEETRTQLLGRAHIKTVRRGEPIFRMGDPGDSMIAVLSGDVRISVASAEGRQITLARLEAGEIIGEIALLDGRERTADATAAADSVIATLNRRDVLPALERSPGALLEVVRILCSRLRQTDQHLAEIALMPLSSRLANALLRLAGGDSDEARISLSQRVLGDMVGASRESVNKCLAEWQRKKLIQIDGTTITLMNRDALEDAGSPA